MIGILLATHGGLASGIVDAMELICGPQEKVKALPLRIKDDIEEYGKNLLKTAEELDDGDGVLILSDLIGGSPANMICRFILQKENIEAIAGLNFPMLIEAVESRNFMDLKKLTKAGIEAGISGVSDIRESILKVSDEEDD